MEKRMLGRTGHQSTVVIFGTAAFWEIDQAGANAALEKVLEAGINHIDVAPQYGLAQERLGPWLPPHRDKFFLGCKTLGRTRDDAWADLRNSLKVLRTNWLDLYQFHAVNTMEELDKAFAPNGAINTLKEAKEQGLVRYLGITGHGLQSPIVFAEALRRFDFDTIMFPINPALYANATYRRDTERLLKMAADRNVGLQIIKAVARGPWGDLQKQYQTWYRPFEDPKVIEQWVHFSLSQPVTAVVSAGDVRLIDPFFKAGQTFTPMSTDQQSELVTEAQELQPLFV